MVTFTLHRVDLSGVEVTLETGTERAVLLINRDWLRKFTDHKRVHYRVTDDEGRDVEWDDDEPFVEAVA